MHTHEGVLTEIFRAGNCHREEQPRGDQLMEGGDTADSGHLLLSACIAHCWLPEGCCCCCCCPNIPLKNWNCALARAKRENARIKSESLDNNDMAVAVDDHEMHASVTRRLRSRGHRLILQLYCVLPQGGIRSRYDIMFPAALLVQTR